MSSQYSYEIPDNAVPDEVFETPLFKMERFGRYIKINTARTQEQHQELIKRIVTHRPELRSRATAIRAELLELTHRYNSLELLAHLIAQNGFYDPDKYREFDSPLRPHFVEYMALLELCDQQYEYRRVEAPPGEDVEKAQALLEELFSTTIFHYQTEHISESSGSVPSALQELRLTAITHNIGIRSPAYHDHWVEVLVALFSTPAVSGWLTGQQLGIHDILKCINACGRILPARLRSRIEMAKKERDALRLKLRELRRGRGVAAEEAELLNMLASRNGKDRRAMMDSMLAQWAFLDLAGTWSFTAADLATEAGTSVQVAQAFLQNFSLTFSRPQDHEPFFKATHDLQLRPFISYEDRFMLAAPHLMLWAVKPSIEALLQNDPAAPWEAYERGRSKLLVQKGIEYLCGAMPTGGYAQELYYNSAGKRCELDGIFTFDRYIFLVEAKAGAASPAGRRGAPKSIITDLKQLVRDPANQANRAKQFIESESIPTFTLKDGTKFAVTKAPYCEVVLVSLTLDNLGMFTSDLADMKKVGLQLPDKAAWAIYLPDLKIVTEVLASPSQFVHYVGWRRDHLESEGVSSGNDELNWLGIYLKEGPTRFRRTADLDFMSFTSYTDKFDDYFLSLMGERSTLARRPSQWMPREMFQIIGQLESAGTLGYTRATDALLNLSLGERKQLGKILRRHGKHGRLEALLKGEQVIAIITAGKTTQQCEEIAQQMAKEHAKSAVVLSLCSSSVEWGAAEPS